MNDANAQQLDSKAIDVSFSLKQSESLHSIHALDICFICSLASLYWTYELVMSMYLPSTMCHRALRDDSFPEPVGLECAWSA